MNITVEQSMEMPDVVLFARKLSAALKVEQKRRRHFYKVVDESQKMEFINGEIFFHSPVKLEHNSATLCLAKLLDSYVVEKDLGYIGVEKILVSLTRNDYEPDICFFSKEKSSNFRPKQMQFPVPDFVVEVLSESTERHDRETKFQDYAAHGVREYWIIDPDHKTVEQYLLDDDQYNLVLKASDGHLESDVIDGFRIPIAAIFDRVENAAALRNILKLHS
jgi:Uma2 family endonuclease